MPKRTLTAASVERLKPPAVGQVEHFDSGWPGLALRVSYGGQKAWAFFYRIHGRLRRMTLGTYPAMGLAEAREAWREARLSVAKGVDPARRRGTATAPMGFAAVAEEWLRRDQAKNKSVASVTRIVNRELIPLWGDRPIGEIARRDVRDLVDGIVDRGAVIMARRVHGHLHRLFVWAVGRDIILANPMTGLPMPGEETSRDRTLSDGELVEVWNGAERLGFPFGPAHRLLILTGARREEIGRLKWGETVAGDNIKLAGDRTKTGEPHIIHLSAPAKELLANLPRIAGSDYVFPANGRHITTWSYAKEKLDALVKIEPWRVHDFRRTVATGMQRLGVNLQTIEAVLGHVGGSRRGIVGVYQRHSFSDEAAAALEAWGAHVMALVEGRAPGKVLPLRGQR